MRLMSKQTWFIGISSFLAGVGAWYLVGVADRAIGLTGEGWAEVWLSANSNYCLDTEGRTHSSTDVGVTRFHIRRGPVAMLITSGSRRFMFALEATRPEYYITLDLQNVTVEEPPSTARLWEITRE